MISSGIHVKTKEEDLLIDGMDVHVDWSKIRYFSQPQPRCVYSIFSLKLGDNSCFGSIGVADYIAMLQVQLVDVDTYD